MFDRSANFISLFASSSTLICCALPSVFIVIGAGGHATSIAESILSCGHEILYFVDRYKSKDKLLGYKIVKNILFVNQLKYMRDIVIDMK